MRVDEDLGSAFERELPVAVERGENLEMFGELSYSIRDGKRVLSEYVRCC